MALAPRATAKSPLERLLWLEGIQRDENVGACATAIAAILAICGNHRTGEANPSLRTLAQRSKRSLTATKKAIKELAASGWIHIRPSWSEQGDRSSNVYQLIARLPLGGPHCAIPEAPDGLGQAPKAPMVGHPTPDREADNVHKPGNLNQDSTLPTDWRGKLEVEVGSAEFQRRLANLSLDAVRAETAFLTAPTPFYRDQAMERHEHTILRALAVNFPNVARVRIVTRSKGLH